MTSPKPARTEGEESLGAVAKAMRVFDVLGRSNGLGLSELSRRSEVPKTTCLRLLRTLQTQGYVAREGTRYRLTWRLLEVGRGAPFCEPGGLRDIALPFLSELHESSGWSVNLAVLDGRDVLYLARIHRTAAFALPGGPGARVPAVCTAIGKAILAFESEERCQTVLAHRIRPLTPHSITNPRILEEQLAKIRTLGIASEREESAMGVTCLAAPVLHRGRAIAAISISGRVERQPARALDGLLRKAVAATASDYATAYGARGRR